MTIINWTTYLDQKFCKADVFNNRPCDNGASCTMCNTEAVQYEYIAWKIKQSKESANND